MGNKRVSQLVELTAPEVQLDDLFLIVDTTARESKKITASELSAFLGASGSLFAIHADNADTASFILGSNVFGLVTSASYAISSSRAISAAIADLVISASYALTASFASNSGGNTSTASFLLFTGGSNGTASYAISASHAIVSDSSKFLIYTGASNGTASYAIKASVSDNATNANTASFLGSTPPFAITSSYSIMSNNSATASFLQYSGIPNGTASYAIVAGSTGTFMKNRGIFLADTQSINIAQLDSVIITPANDSQTTTSIEAFGTITTKFTSSIPTNETLRLMVKNRDTGIDTTLDSTPIYVNISPIPSNWDNYATGTIDIPFTLAGQSFLDGKYLVFVTASTNLSLESARITRFNISSFSDGFDYQITEPIQFYLRPLEATISFTSTDGGPFNDFLPTFNQTSSNKILTLNTSNQSLTDLRYVWSLPNLTTLSCSNNISLTSLTGMPNSLLTMSCQDCGLSSMTSLSNTSMSIFNCQNNNLSSLPGLPSTMSYINCSNNQLTSLPSSLPNNLKYLFCDYLPITSLPGIFPNTITSMSFVFNANLTIWGSSLPTSLVSFNVSNTPIQSLPQLPPPLTFLTASFCSLTVAGMYGICANLATNSVSYSINGGQLDITGNGMPDINTLNAIFILLGNGWNVSFDT